MRALSVRARERWNINQLFLPLYRPWTVKYNQNASICKYPNKHSNVDLKWKLKSLIFTAAFNHIYQECQIWSKKAVKINLYC